MKKVVLFVVFLFLVSAGFAFAKDTQKISLGQYVFEEGKFILLSTTAQARRYDHPYGFRVQPLSTLGTTTSHITSIMTSDAGKWIVTFRVDDEKSPFTVTYQLSPGEIWTLYAVNPMAVMQPSIPLNLKVVSITNNCVEVSVME